MDVSGINSTANITLYKRQSSNAEEAAQKAAEQEAKQGGQKNAVQLPRPEQIHNLPAIRPELIDDYHGLTLEEARSTTSEVSAMIRESNPWKLVEIQPVLDRGLLGGGYY